MGNPLFEDVCPIGKGGFPMAMFVYRIVKNVSPPPTQRLQSAGFESRTSMCRNSAGPAPHVPKVPWRGGIFLAPFFVEKIATAFWLDAKEMS